MNKSQQVLAWSVASGVIAGGVAYWFLPNSRWYGLALVFFVVAAVAYSELLKLYSQQAIIEQDDREKAKRRLP